MKKAWKEENMILREKSEELELVSTDEDWDADKYPVKWSTSPLFENSNFALFEGSNGLNIYYKVITKPNTPAFKYGVQILLPNSTKNNSNRISDIRIAWKGYDGKSGVSDAFELRSCIGSALKFAKKVKGLIRLPVCGINNYDIL